MAIARCGICSKPEVQRAVDSLALAGVSERRIARQVGVTDSTVHRHLSKCLAKATVAAARTSDPRNLAHTESILGELQYLASEAKRLTALAEGEKDYRGAMSGLRESARLLELKARIFIPPPAISAKTVTTNYSIQFIGGRPTARPAGRAELPEAIDVASVEVREPPSTKAEKVDHDWL